MVLHFRFDAIYSRRKFRPSHVLSDCALLGHSRSQYGNLMPGRRVQFLSKRLFLRNSPAHNKQSRTLLPVPARPAIHSDGSVSRASLNSVGIFQRKKCPLDIVHSCWFCLPAAGHLVLGDASRQGSRGDGAGGLLPDRVGVGLDGQASQDRGASAAGGRQERRVSGRW